MSSLLETGEFGRILVRWGVVVAVAASGTELLPVLFGTGADAVWDWSFTYVTVRFVLLPAFCVAHFIVAAVFAVRWVRQRPAVSWLPVTSVAVSALYLIGLKVYPLPWFVGTL